jgi:hypothetical protein
MFAAMFLFTITFNSNISGISCWSMFLFMIIIINTYIQKIHEIPQQFLFSKCLTLI